MTIWDKSKKRRLTGRWLKMSFSSLLGLAFLILFWFYLVAFTAMLFTGGEQENKLRLIIVANAVLFSLPALAIYRYMFDIETASLSPKTFLVVVSVFAVLGSIWTRYPLLLFKLLLGIKNVGYSEAFSSIFYDGKKANVSDCSRFAVFTLERFGRVVDTDYGNDQEQAYYKGVKIKNVDVPSFKVLEFLRSGKVLAKDRAGFIYEGERIGKGELKGLRRSAFDRE